MARAARSVLPGLRIRRRHMNRDCIFSPDRKYRYSLWRTWEDLFNVDSRFVAFVCLNPSVADERNDDPTVRRCVDYSKRWKFVTYCMLNIFAFRSTDPNVMLKERDPIGPDNDRIILEIAREASLVVCAWGNHGAHLGRDRHVTKMLTGAGVKLTCLRLTDAGQPWHPLYLPANLKPTPYENATKTQTQQ